MMCSAAGCVCGCVGGEGSKQREKRKMREGKVRKNNLVPGRYPGRFALYTYKQCTLRHCEDSYILHSMGSSEGTPISVKPEVEWTKVG